MPVKTAPKKIAPQNQFPLVDTNYLIENFGLSPKDIIAMRKSLPCPTYWVQRDRKVNYNLRLWEHYIRCVMNGNDGDRKDHDRLLEDYSAHLEGILTGAKGSGNQINSRN